MTSAVPTTTVFENTGDGENLEFSFPLRFLESGDLFVEVDGVEQTLGVHYTLDGVADPAGGTIIFDELYPPASGAVVRRYRRTAPKQVVDLTDTGRTPGNTLELQLDRFAMAMQDIRERVDEIDELAQGEQGLPGADGLGALTFSTIVAAAAYSPAVGPDFIATAGYSASGDYGAALYKKVASQPSHAGKFSITLAGGALTWYEIAEPEIHVAMLGVKMDGVTDDKAAFLKAHEVGRPLRLGPGVIRFGSMLTVTDRMPIWRGSGSDVTYGGQLDHPNTTTIIGDHSDIAVIKIDIASDPAGESMVLEGFEVSGKPSGPPDNQHGIIIDDCSTAWSRYFDLVFSNLTGAGIAYDPTGDNYSQNVSMRDLSFFNTGGDLGLTAEPANSAAYLAGTLLRIDNVNHDHNINQQSPQAFVWDFRAFREVSADTFLIEGLDAIPTLIGFATDASNVFNNVHIEFSGIQHTNIAAFYRDSTAQFYAGQECRVEFDHLEGEGRFLFEDGTEAQLRVRDWSNYVATKWQDLISLSGTSGGSIAGHMIVEQLHLAAPFQVPIWLQGRLDIVSQHAQNVVGPVTERAIVTRIASWRPAMGSPSAFAAHTMSWLNSNNASAAIEEDDKDTRLQVYRMTGSVGLGPNPNPRAHIPYDWFEVTLAYDAQTANFTQNSVLTGGTSGAKAKIISDVDAGTTGTLKLKMLTATNFVDNETITDAAGGSATANGAPTKASPVMTMAIRWKATLDPVDVAAGIYARWPSAGPDYAGQTYAIDSTSSGFNDEWRTTVLHFRGNASTCSTTMDFLGGTPTVAVVVRVAAVDLFLGRGWSEPLDLSYV